MNVFILGFLFVIVIPLAEGLLFALLLREVHIRHPLPLGGVIETAARRRIREAKRAAEAAKAKEKAKAKSVPIAPPVEVPLESADSPVTVESTVEASIEEGQIQKPSAVDVFDEAAHIPNNLPVNEVLDLMTKESPVDIPNDFETQIEASARSETEIPSGVREPNDEMNAEDLDALAAALPRDKIDFSQELDPDSAVSSPISSTAKEVLGENFDFEALKSPLSTMTKATMANIAPMNAVLSDVVLDVQEDVAGTIQVSSPFLSDVLLQYADFTSPQTVLPTFSQEWIQETDGMTTPTESDSTQFCFTEEMPPMFARKKKSS